MMLTRWLPNGPLPLARLAGSGLLSLAAGCIGTGLSTSDTAAQRLPTPQFVAFQQTVPGGQAAPDALRLDVIPVGHLEADQPAGKQGKQEEADKSTAKQPKSQDKAPLERSAPPLAVTADGGVSVRRQPLTLPEAIGLAFQFQPRLRAALESIEQAAGRQDVVRAAFLPVASTGYHVGGFDLTVGGEGIPLGQGAQALAQRFTFVPFTGSLPIGLDINTGYEFAEFKVQWLICDFGRRLGRREQAALATDVAQLQSDRARQTVANEVALAYYQILRARSLKQTAQASVRRAEDDLDVARKLVKGGAEVREVALRAEVMLAQSQRAMDLAEEAEGLAVAGFTLAVGLNTNAPPVLADEGPDVPPFACSLTDCLQTAIAQRHEFAVAQRAISSAQAGVRVAKAEFAPRLVAEGALFDFQQANPRGHADLAQGLIKLEWTMFEGGKRVAEKRIADSKVREAMAQADEIADVITFQVNRAFLQVIASRKAIDRSKPAVASARENHRLVRARLKAGDATASEVVDAESTLTRAEQDYLNSLYDYRTALIRLDYAVGANPAIAPVAPVPHH
jgi:outer membrane protein